MSLIKDLVLQQDSFRLEIPNLELLDKGLHLLSGPSGSGKSTLLSILLGLLDAGNYSWNFKGTDLAQLSPADRRIGIVFQNLGLFPHMTARENIEFVIKARKLEIKSAREKMESYISCGP